MSTAPASTASAAPETDPVKAGGWLELLVLLAALLVPLALNALPFTADGRNHILRTVLLSHSLAAGDWFPRYSPELAYGYGAPLFNYYAPLIYYLTALASALGLGPSLGFQIVMGASLVLGSSGAALWAGSWFGPQARVAAGVAWAAAPYVLYDVYTRGAGPEVLGLAWLPWIGWALTESVRHGTLRGRVALCLSVAGLLFSHNLTALVGAGLLAVIGLVEVILAATSDRQPGLQRRLIWAGVAGLIGAAITAFFWMPAVLETGYVKMSAATDLADFDFRTNFLSLSSLLTGAFTFDPKRVLPPVPTSLGWGALLLGGLSLITAVQSQSRITRLRIALCLALAAGCVFMTLSVSRPVWEVLPLAQLIQFPSRWLGPASLLFALLGGAAAAWIHGRWPGLDPWSRWALPIGLLVLSWPWTFSKPDPTLPRAPALSALYAAEVDLETLGLTSTGEFLPVDSNVPAPDQAWAEAVYAGAGERVDRSRLTAAVTVDTLAQDRLSAQVSVASAQPVALTFRWLDWPGWQATLDGAPLAVQAGPGEGFVTLTVPAGEHQVEVWLGSTPLRQGAQAVSWIGLAAGGVLLGLASRQTRPPQVAFAIASSARVAAPAVGLGVALVLARTALEMFPNPLRSTRLAGSTIADVGTPLQMRFGDVFTLLGIDAPATVSADTPLTLTTYWAATAPVGQDLSYSVQLWDQENAFIAQADVMNPGGFPVRRWLPGDYTDDTLTIVIDPTVPPGRLRLMATVYTTDEPRATVPGRRADGPLENYVEIGEVVITRSTTPALPEAVAGVSWTPLKAGPLAAVAPVDLPEAVRAGDALRLTFYWSARAIPANDGPELVLRDAQGREHDLGPARLETADFPRSAWQPGDVWRLQTPVVIPAGIASGPAQWLLCTAQEDLVLGTAAVTVPDRRADLPADLQGQPVSFDQVADLAGYRLTSAARPGEAWVVELVWRSTTVTPRPLTVFVQLLGPDGFPIAQSDSQPAEGQRPTTGWLPPEIILDRHTLDLPTTLSAGSYPLVVGLYDPLDGTRVRVGDADLTTLQLVEVVP